MKAGAGLLLALGFAANVLGRADFPKRRGTGELDKGNKHVYQARQYNPHGGSHVQHARQAGPSAVLPGTQPPVCAPNAHLGPAGACVCNSGYSGPVTACVINPVVAPPIQPTLPTVASFHVTGGGTLLTNAAGQTVYQVPVGQTATLDSVVSVTPGSTNSFSVVASLSTGGSVRIIVTDATPAGRLRRSKAKRAAGDVLCDTGALSGTDVQADINCYVGSATAVSVGYVVSGGTVAQPQAAFLYSGACQSNCGGSATTPTTPVVPATPPNDPSTTTTAAATSAAATTSPTTSSPTTPTPTPPALACPSASTASGASCVCSSGFSYVASSNTCVTCNSLGASNGADGVCGAACPTNATASGATCVCADTFTYSNGQCVLCTTLGFTAGTGGQCSTAPTTPTGPTTCADGSSYDTATASCSLCNSRGLLNGVGGACGVACPAGVTASGSVCLCPLGSTYRNALCSTCTSLGLLNGAVPGACGVSCPAGSASTGTTCSCLAGNAYQSGSNTCVSICPVGTTYNPATANCECGVDATLTISGCIPCSAQGKLNSGAANSCGASCPPTATPVNGACLCPATSQLISGVCVPCFSLGRGDGPVAGGTCSTTCIDATKTLSGNSCGCPAGTAIPPGGSSCQCTAANTVLDGATCKCLASAQRVGGACTLCSDLGFVDGTTLEGSCAAACLDPTQALNGGICAACTSGTSIVAGVCVPCATQNKADGASGSCGVTCTGASSPQGGACVGCSLQTPPLADGVAGIACGTPCTGAATLVTGVCLSCAAQGLSDAVNGSGCGPACTLPEVLGSGVCSCPVTGQSVVVGVCTCPDANFEVVASACTCKAGFALNASGQCISVCAASNALLGSSPSGGACGDVCPINSAPNAAGTACVCAELTQGLVNGACASCLSSSNALPSTDGISCGTACTGTSAVPNAAGDACECPAGLEYVGLAITPSGCRCPVGSILSGGTCVTCDTTKGLTSNPLGDTCRCSDITRGIDETGACTACSTQGVKRPSQDGLQCGYSCPSASHLAQDGNCYCNNSVLDFVNESCICAAGKWRGGQFGCSYCAANSVVNADQSGCICNDHKYYFSPGYGGSGACVLCPATSFPGDGVTCGPTLTCGSGQHNVPGPACACNNDALSYVNGNCICPADKWLGGSFGCAYCPNGATPAADQRSCICPAGSFWVPSGNSGGCQSCVQTGDAGPSILNAAGNGCTCQEPTAWYNSYYGCNACDQGTPFLPASFVASTGQCRCADPNAVFNGNYFLPKSRTTGNVYDPCSFTCSPKGTTSAAGNTCDCPAGSNYYNYGSLVGCS